MMIVWLLTLIAVTVSTLGVQMLNEHHKPKHAPIKVPVSASRRR
jgi:hypothetical protein